MISFLAAAQADRPYAALAWGYRAAGSLPIPAAAKGRYLRRRRDGTEVYGTGKSPVPVGYTGYAGYAPSGPDIQTWCDGPEAGDNIALRLSAGLLGIDVDAYDGKPGETSLARLVAQHGPLPPTVSVTARGSGQPARTYLYRADLPDDRVWIDHPAGADGGIDAIHIGHRYVIAPGSIHPQLGTRYLAYGGDGTVLDAYIGPHLYATLPPAWVQALSKPGAAMAGSAAGGAVTRTILAAFRRGRACPQVDDAISAMIARITEAGRSGGAMHDPGELLYLTSLGMEGHVGVAEALTRHYATYVTTRARVRDLNESEVGDEWWRMVRGAVGKQLAARGGRITTECACAMNEVDRLLAALPTARLDGDHLVAEVVEAVHVEHADGAVPGVGPQVPPDPFCEFWGARPGLTHIQTFARGRRASPWAVLGVTLARIAALTPPHVVLPPMTGGYGSLNLFIALVGPSGAGKGAAGAAAAAALTLPHDPYQIGVGSGEGLARLYAHRRRLPRSEGGGWDPVLVRDRDSVLLSVPEVDNLVALGTRQGATLLPQLRQAWSGESLGFSYSDPEKAVSLPEHSYRLTMIVGVQPGRAGALLGDADGGTPQRFIWLPVQDPQAPDIAPPPPAPHDWAATVPAPSLGQFVIHVPEDIRVEVDADRLARLRGQDGTDLDAHAMLARLKIAAGLALLDMRAGITTEDWQLAQTVMHVSAATRELVERHLTQAAETANRARGRLEGVRGVEAEDALRSHRTQRVARTIRRRAAREAERGDPRAWLPLNELRRAVAGPDRDVLFDALDHLVAAGDLQTETDDTDRPRYRLRP